MYSVHCIKDNTFPFLIIQLFAWISFISNLERWLKLLPNDSDDERCWWKSKVGCLQFSAGNLADCSSHSLQQLQAFSSLPIFIKLIVIITPPGYHWLCFICKNRCSVNNFLKTLHYDLSNICSWDSVSAIYHYQISICMYIVHVIKY